ncbi:MAG: phosphate ABC transporter permease subunit PstC [Candidatus Eisenbacteria bacterium RBG_16_71_46]|nr:MAG: phosphate ABC transporter permease subunit PstC [Candidatus Eisenbacteria bacterium RBG_16_71_46]
MGTPWPARPPGRARRWAFADGAYRGLLTAFALFVFVIAALIVYESARGSGLSVRTFGWSFLTSTEWDPVAGRFGALPYLYGTLVSSGLAMLLSVPLGLGAAVFLAELAPRRVGDAVAFVVELLASIPSIVYGIWGLFVLAPFLRTALEPWLIRHLGFLPLFEGFPFGIGMLNAGIVLAVMVLPTIVSLSREILLSTPRTLREAALALGSTRSEAIGVVLDAARPGILGAVILGLGRALGETMAVTMVIGNASRISASLLAPGATMASVIANEFTEATGDLYLSALIEIALVLFVLTLLVNAVARLLVHWAAGGRRDVAGTA